MPAPSPCPRARAISLLAAALAVGAPGLAEAKEPPVLFEAQGVKNVQIGLSGGSFDVMVQAERTRGLAVKLRHLEYEILLAGQPFSEASRDYDGMKLRKGEPQLIPIPVRFDAEKALKAGMAALGSEKLEVRVRGEAKLSVLCIPFTVPFDQRSALKPGKGKKKK